MLTKRPPALYLTLIGIGALWIGSVIRLDPFLFYNPSASAPIGWYRILPERPVARGDLVAARLPEAAGILASARGYLPGDIPVIKTVWALTDFDSRYFGPVRAGDIIGRVAFIGNLPITMPPACVRQDICSHQIRSLQPYPLLLTKRAPSMRATRPSRTWRNARDAG